LGGRGSGLGAKVGAVGLREGFVRGCVSVEKSSWGVRPGSSWGRLLGGVLIRGEWRRWRASWGVGWQVG
jgi:hypothetical protein